MAPTPWPGNSYETGSAASIAAPRGLAGLCLAGVYSSPLADDAVEEEWRKPGEQLTWDWYQLLNSP